MTSQGLSITFSKPIPAMFYHMMLEYLMFLASHKTTESIKLVLLNKQQ